MSHAATIHRRRVSVHSTELATTIRRGIGWEAYCACGWVDPHLYRDRDEARHAARDHREREQVGAA